MEKVLLLLILGVLMFGPWVAGIMIAVSLLILFCMWIIST